MASLGKAMESLGGRAQLGKIYFWRCLVARGVPWKVVPTLVSSCALPIYQDLSTFSGIHFYCHNRLQPSENMNFCFVQFFSPVSCIYEILYSVRIGTWITQQIIAMCCFGRISDFTKALKHIV